jgi:hypothetical protein
MISMEIDKRLLGGLYFVSRTFEGSFKENPYVLDLDANLYIGPADHVARDEHAGVEVVYHFLAHRGRITVPVGTLLRNRQLLLDAFAAFDEARLEARENEFRIIIFGTYDGSPLHPADDDDLPAGPCGKSINEVKRHFYVMCRRIDRQFHERGLNAVQRKAEARFLAAAQ